ncbi:MAG TPA: CbiX/SirB N-terminal domain-containing protein [Methanocella sp.]|jgi:sirohydrochlorin ferrochelatase
MMKDTGVLIVQHGDFPLDFIEKEPETYRRIESFLHRLSEASKKLDHGPEYDPHAADTLKLVDMLRAAGYDIEIGYLDFAQPTIADAVEALKARGHKKIIIANTPGLMMRSSHSIIDIPAAVGAIGAKEPGLELIYAKPGGPLPLIARAIGKKINVALGEGFASMAALPKAAHPGTAVVLVAHGDTPRGFVPDAGLMKDFGKDMARGSKALLEWPRAGENDPHYSDSLVLLTMLREMFWPMPLEIGYLEFARPSVGEAFDRLVAAGAKRILVAGGSSFFNRSSHTLIDIPEAIARLQQWRPDAEVTYAYPDLDLVKDELTRAIVYNIEKTLERATEGTEVTDVAR